MIQEFETWTCHICGQERPDELIGVISTDVSHEYNLAAGTMTQNVRYCTDNKACAEAAKTYRFLKMRASAR
jgi:hypothetical protein